jgi:large subunit ribosomal protein L35
MPKMKSHSGAKKRFSLTATGKVKRGHQGKSHILSKKTTKRKRRLRTGTYVSATQEKTVKTLIPYKK